MYGLTLSCLCIDVVLTDPAITVGLVYIILFSVSCLHLPLIQNASLMRPNMVKTIDSQTLD